MRYKRGFVGWDVLVPWIIGFGILIITLFLYASLNDSGEGAIGFLRNLFRFG